MSTLALFPFVSAAKALYIGISHPSLLGRESFPGVDKRAVTEFVKHLPKGLQKDQTISIELHRLIYKKLNVPPTKP